MIYFKIFYKGDVFTMDLLEAYIAYKRQVELDPMRIRPTPYEFTLLIFDGVHNIPCGVHAIQLSIFLLNVVN